MTKKLPPDPYLINENRAQFAVKVLGFFDRYGESSEYPATRKEVRINLEATLADLVADLAHYCDRHGLSMKNIVRGATRRYSLTTDGQGTQFEKS